jgi:hypothetical protein
MLQMEYLDEKIGVIQPRTDTNHDHQSQSTVEIAGNGWLFEFQLEQPTLAWRRCTFNVSLMQTFYFYVFASDPFFQATRFSIKAFVVTNQKKIIFVFCIFAFSHFRFSGGPCSHADSPCTLLPGVGLQPTVCCRSTYSALHRASLADTLLESEKDGPTLEYDTCR